MLGSIPTGIIVARVYRNVDLTAHGSGRTGATNVLRTLGSGAAAIAFAGDFLKGLLAVLAVRYLIAPNDSWAELIAAAAAVIGHSYSVFIHFKGGRGVVTGFGATVVAAPVPIFIALAVGMLLVALTRYVSLGSVVGATLAGLLMCAFAVTTGELRGRCGASAWAASSWSPTRTTSNACWQAPNANWANALCEVRPADFEVSLARRAATDCQHAGSDCAHR